MLNEARFGRTRLDGGTDPAHALDPANFGIGNGVDRPIGMPQFNVAGGLNFGGPATIPAGPYTTPRISFADTLQFTRGRHSIKTGAEFRQFLNENFAEGTGAFNFPSVGGVSLRNRQCVQHHAGRAAESHHSASAVVLRAGHRQHPADPDRRSRPALRMACHAHRAGQPVRGLRRRHARRSCASASTSRRSIARTTGTSNRGSGVAWDVSGDGRTVCAGPTAGRSMNRARRR